MNFDRACATYSLKFISTLTSGMFAGGAIYINLVESPARLTHDAETALTIWKPSLIRAGRYMSSIALTSAISSVAVYWLTEERCFRTWLLAGGMMSTIPIFSIVCVLPTNKELLETEKCLDKGTTWIVNKLNSWNKLHAVRSVISLGSFAYMMWLLSKNK